MSAKGHYLPPCSNGRNHNYYADIILFDGAGKKIAGTYIDWGRYSFFLRNLTMAATVKST